MPRGISKRQLEHLVSDAADIALTNNGATVFGATSNSLAILDGASHEGEMYYVIITNGAGSVTSDTVTITLGKFMHIMEQIGLVQYNYIIYVVYR